MSVRRRYLNGLPRSKPIPHQDCHTVIEMDRPEMSVVEHTQHNGPGPDFRSVGLLLVANGVAVDVQHLDVDGLIRDLESARLWRRRG